MRAGIGIFAVLAAAAAVVLAIVLIDGGGNSPVTQADALTGEPSVEIVSPRNGARQSSRAVVVKVRVHDFSLAPRDFGGEPQLAEGHIPSALNRVPDCADPVKLQRAVNSPVGRGRLVGA